MAAQSSRVTFARRRNYGRDRLSITLVDGAEVGYWDLVTDEPHPARPALGVFLETAYAEWSAQWSAQWSAEWAAEWSAEWAATRVADGPAHPVVEEAPAS
jgi:hypothetical protein